MPSLFLVMIKGPLKSVTDKFASGQNPIALAPDRTGLIFTVSRRNHGWGLEVILYYLTSFSGNRGRGSVLVSNHGHVVDCCQGLLCGALACELFTS